MKYIIVLSAVLVVLCTACTNNSVRPAEITTPKTSVAANADSIAIAESLRGFFAWFEANDDRISAFNFINDAGKYLTLDEKILAQYHAEVMKSGFVSSEFIADETKFYQACAKFWVNEDKGDVPTGLDADRYYCAQDFVAPYSKGAVKSTITGDRAKAVLILTEPESKLTSEFNFDMKKENGKWLLAKLDCDLGVSY